MSHEPGLEPMRVYGRARQREVRPVGLHGGERTVQTLTAAELAAMDLPEPRWIIAGLLPEGLSILAGRPKLGKSWLGLALAIAVATGGEALGQLSTEPGDVLFLALEDTARRLKSRLAVFGEAPKRLHLATQWPKAEDGGLAELDAWLASHPEARMVLIDTLQRFRKPHRGNADLYGGDYGAMEGLQLLAGKYNVAIVVLHHVRKSEAADPLDMVSGTHGLTGGADSVLVLARARGEADATLDVAGRDVSEQSLALRFDGGRWDLLGDAREHAMSQTRRRIMEALRQAGAMKPKQIADALDISPANAKKTLWTMFTEGMLASRDGWYSIPANNGNPGNRSNPSNPSNRSNPEPVTEGYRPVTYPVTQDIEDTDGENDARLLGLPRLPEGGDPLDGPTCVDCGRQVERVSPTGFCSDCGG